jgi:hypothetical protein
MGYYGSPYDEEDRRSALTQGLLAAGLAALGARKGSEYNAFAQAGLLGLGGFNSSLKNATEARDDKFLRELRMQQWDMAKQEHALKLKQMQDAQAQQQADQQALPGLFSGGSPQLAQMGPGGPTPQNAQAVAPRTNPAAQYMADRQGQGVRRHRQADGRGILDLARHRHGRAGQSSVYPVQQAWWNEGCTRRDATAGATSVEPW